MGAKIEKTFIFLDGQRCKTIFFCAKQYNGREFFLLLQKNMKIHTNHKNQIIMEAENGKYIFGVVKVGERGQIVIPKEAREVYGIKPGDSLLVLGDSKGMAILKTEIFQDKIDEMLGGTDHGTQALD